MSGLFLAGMALFTIGVLSNRKRESEVTKRLKKIIKNIDPIFSNVKIYEHTESYTFNKSEIYICTKDENGKYYDMNTLVYVTLHELAHLIARGEKHDHDETFLKIFNNLLKKAKSKKIWSDTIPMPKMYCGVLH